MPAKTASHDARWRDVLDRAVTLCAEAGTELTPLRQQVLHILFEQKRAMGAYDLSEACGRPSGSVPSLYRVLKFWCDVGIVTYLPGRNAFVLVDSPAEQALFLVCTRCGRVAQHSNASVHRTVWQVAQRAGFQPQAPAIEILGLCSSCSE
jgi:Fur family zinc uptake transcriptional regulator